MEKSSKRGKIPQSDWPSIMARYEAGETLSSIARTYDCSPPAISYVVSRSRARHPAAAAPTTTAAETQLVKATSETAAADAPVVPAAASGYPYATAQSRPPTPLDADRVATLPHPELRSRNEDTVRPNGVLHHHVDAPAPPGGPQLPIASNGEVNRGEVNRGEASRTLHLSLGGGAANGGRPHPEAPPLTPSPVLPSRGDGEPAGSPANGATADAAGHRNGNGDWHHYDGAPHRNGPQVGPQVGPREANGNGDRKEGSATFIDQELRTRVDGDIAAFLAAFDAALQQDTQENRSLLREATDRLLRAGARTRIELERLEARVPLTPRDSGHRGEAGWRQR